MVNFKSDNETIFDETTMSFVFDKELAISRVGSVEVFAQVAIFFHEYSARLLAELDDVLNKSSYTEIENCAHKIKGAVSNFAAGRASKSAENLERSSSMKDSLAVASASVQLKKDVLALDRELQQKFG